MAGKTSIYNPPKPTKKYSLIEEIKKHPLYKSSSRSNRARKMIDETLKNNKKIHHAVTEMKPGQLVLFNYLNPKTQEELEYYDASPCTIFFGEFNSKEGRRVLGFNIHYYPPRIRYQVMNKIFEMYKPVYEKYFSTGVARDLDAFDYAYLVTQLEKYNLSFGVRMYIPALIGGVKVIPPAQWPTAIMTEGIFKKETRARIIKLWTEDSKEKKKYTNVRGANYKRKR